MSGSVGRDLTGIVRSLMSALAHRGPDGEGLHRSLDSRVVFGHRRLSIVDIEGGAQPMSNEDARMWVVFNGELYNHQILRAELQELGHVFRTRADTEVLLHGWEEWGPSLLRRLNGIYAFALLDERGPEAIVWLARDPVGVKPLFVGCSDGSWWFSSELRAAQQAGLVDDNFRVAAFSEYLVYRFVPSPGTFFRNAWKVPPGHLCSLSLNSLPDSPRFMPFATEFRPTTLPDSASEWSEVLVSQLGAAVRRQLMSDVPVGSLLSGGVDSTVVTKEMNEGLRVPPSAFAVGFSDRPELDELSKARFAARVIGVPLTEVAIPERTYRERWPIQVAGIAEPIANSSALMLSILCHTVRATHKVVLTGQGADEPLGGYPRHVAERFRRAIRFAGPMLGRLPERMLITDRISRLRRISSTRDEAWRFAETLSVFGPADAIAFNRQKLDSDELVQPVRRWLTDDGDGDSLNRLLKVDARLSLADDLLIIADHMAMASSVELRVPFLDLEFLGLIEAMPSRYKISRFGERKWLYRKAVGASLPAELLSPLTGWGARTGRKLGFSTPLDDWFGKWVATEAESFLLGKQACLPEYLSPNGVGELITDARERRLPRSRQLMSLFVLETWLRSVLSGARPARALEGAA